MFEPTRSGKRKEGLGHSLFAPTQRAPRARAPHPGASPALPVFLRPALKTSDPDATASDAAGRVPLFLQPPRGEAGPAPLDAGAPLNAGMPLDAGDRTQFERFFGADLSGVRLHTGDDAQRTSAALGARAFSHGQHIGLGSGYPPRGHGGARLLAHELSHVVQRRASPTLETTGLSSRSDPAEVEARAAADAFVAGRDHVSLRAQPARLALEDGPSTATPQPTAGTLRITLDHLRPWLYSIEGGTPAEAARELYGADLSTLEGSERVMRWSTDEGFHVADRRELFPDMLREPWLARFHAAMQTVLDRDVNDIEEALLDSDSSSVRQTLRWWADRRDLRRPSGESYFDAFLQRLRDERWYTDYLLWESERRPFLDLVYSVLGTPAAMEIIGPASERFGFYRPLTYAPGTGFVASNEPVDPTLIRRGSDVLMDRLEGYTSSSDSRDILRVLRLLPPQLQARTLNHFMQRYGDRETSWGLSRSGEPTPTHMLFWLFEDLSSGDRTALAAQLRQNGVLDPQVVDRLVAGRSWAGRYLPTTTYYGEQAAQFWADEYVQGNTLAAVPGVFASLWTPETATSTILTLTGARVFPALGEASPTLGRGLLVAGTGVTAYTGTIALQEAITGRNAYTGQPISFEDRIGRILETISSALLLTAGFMAAVRLSPGTALARPEPSGLPAPVEPPTATGAGTGGARPVWRVVSTNPETGDFHFLGRHPGTGEIYSVRGNVTTGDAVITNMSTGEVVGYMRGGVLGPPAPGGALPPPETTVARGGPPAPSGGALQPLPGEAVPPGPTGTRLPPAPTTGPRLPPAPVPRALPAPAQTSPATLATQVFDQAYLQTLSDPMRARYTRLQEQAAAGTLPEGGPPLHERLQLLAEVRGIREGLTQAVTTNADALALGGRNITFGSYAVRLPNGRVVSDDVLAVSGKGTSRAITENVGPAFGERTIVPDVNRPTARFEPTRSGGTHDAERKLFEHILAVLERESGITLVRGESYVGRGFSGTIEVSTEMLPCDSCANIISQQFRAMFGNDIQVIIRYGVNYP